MEPIFYQLGIILIVAAILGGIMRFFKQPLVLAYIVTGIVLGMIPVMGLHDAEAFHSFAQIGIAFLLFIVGMTLNLRVFREVGKPALVSGFGQILFTSLVGYYILRALDFAHFESILGAVAISFSSTIVIVKLLTDKGDLETLYGKVSIGLLIVQDIIAFFVLIIIASLGDVGQAVGLSTIMLTLLKGGLLFIIAFLFHRYILPVLFEKSAAQQEYLFLSGITWCFLLSLLSVLLGFTIEMGALVAGITLATLPYAKDMMGQIKPLRDFFLILFFIMLGAQLSLDSIATLIVPAIIISLFVLIGNPLILMTILGAMGFTRRTSFMAGLTVAQISEFSLVVALLGKQLGIVNSALVEVLILVGLLTIAGSAYQITFSEQIYNKIEKYLRIFERKKLFEKKLSLHKNKHYDLVLLGYHRVGYHIVKKVKSKKVPFIVIDYNPQVIKELMRRNIPCMYGDVEHPEILQQIKSFKPKLVISTTHNFEGTLVILNALKKIRRRVLKIVSANTVKESFTLYDEGADYVILPHVLGGEKVADILKGVIKKKGQLKKIRVDHIKSLLDTEIPLN